MRFIHTMLLSVLTVFGCTSVSGSSSTNQSLPAHAEVRPDGKICLKETNPNDMYDWHDWAGHQPFSFVFEGVSYVTSNDIWKCRKHAIRLPDERYILPRIWLHSNPPQIDWKSARVVSALPKDWYSVDAKVD